MINLLHNTELDLQGRLFRAGSVATDLPLVFVIIGGIWSCGFWQLDMCDLKIVLCVGRGVGAYEEAVGGERLVRKAGLC